MNKRVRYETLVNGKVKGGQVKVQPGFADGSPNENDLNEGTVHIRSNNEGIITFGTSGEIGNTATIMG